ncbi:MAG: riboflavin synthase [Candidatus Omnitrophica bacterium]|nr:riboflavin synthase [Candidatus Omnitrophota bacterium]
MFTGIVKEIGQVETFLKRGTAATLGIRSKTVSLETSASDSVAINGACLTVTEKKNDLLFFDTVESTLEKTNLAKLKKGDFVNVEPALKVGDKLGGHFVLGHVDTTARLRRVIKKSTYWQLEVELPAKVRTHIVENGSLTLEGISLTIKKIYPRYFTLDIIPFTCGHTNIKYKKPGDRLNIEFDYLLKKLEAEKRG